MAKYTLGDIFEGTFPITQRYGERPEYYNQFNLAGHEGVDFGTPNGTPIKAPFKGVILRDTFGDKDYGNFTVVWDPIQLCAVWFCHLQDVTTNVGNSVTVGQVIGHTNNSGNSQGPHLHFNFVETDSLGNRLNKNNGFQGFLNALDPNLVEWKLGQTPDLNARIQQLERALSDERKRGDDNYTFFQNALHTISDRDAEIEKLKDELKTQTTIVVSPPPTSTTILTQEKDYSVEELIKKLWQKLTHISN